MKAMSRVISLFVAAVVAGVTAACGGQAPAARETADPVDRYSAQDVGFYRHLRPGEGTILKRQPASLAAAIDGTTATVLASVSGVRAGRTLYDLQFVEVELKVSEVLRGALRPELNGVVRVEFPLNFLPDPVAPAVTDMSARLPKAPAVWLLRWEGEPPEARKPGAPAEDPTADKRLYRVIHPNSGVFAQGDNQVVAMTAQAEDESGPALGAQLEGERFRKLSDLVTRTRQK